jgi:hypothetical protein
MKNRKPKPYIFELKIHPREHFVDLVSAAVGGDVEAQRSTTAIIGWLRRYTRDAADCFRCGTPLLQRPGALVVMLPVPRAKHRAIAGGLCPDCCALPGPSLLDGVMGTVTRAMPSARLHVVPVAGGTA